MYTFCLGSSTNISIEVEDESNKADPDQEEDSIIIDPSKSELYLCII